jgi:hypothetical protein
VLEELAVVGMGTADTAVCAEAVLHTAADEVLAGHKLVVLLAGLGIVAVADGSRGVAVEAPALRSRRRVAVPVEQVG